MGSEGSLGAYWPVTSTWSRADSIRRSRNCPRLSSSIRASPLPMSSSVHLRLCRAARGRSLSCALATRLSPRDFSQAANSSTTASATSWRDAMTKPPSWNSERSSSLPFRHRLANSRCGRRQGWETRPSRSALAEAKRLHPSLSVEWVEKYHPIVHAKDRAVYIEGLRAAGLRIIPGTTAPHPAAWCPSDWRRRSRRALRARGRRSSPSAAAPHQAKFLNPVPRRAPVASARYAT